MKSVSDIEKMKQNRDFDALFRALFNENESVGIAAVEALGELGGERAVLSLIEILGSQKKNLRKAAAHVLGNLKDGRAIEPLINALIDDFGDVGRAAQNALVQLKEYGSVQALSEALKSDDIRLRREIVKTLGSIGDEVALGLLITTLDDPEPIVCRQAAYALGKKGNFSAVLPLIHVLETDTAGAAGAAAFSLGTIGDKRAVAPLIKILKDEVKGVVANAVVSLGKLNDERAVEPLIDAVDKGVCKRTAIEALGELKDKRATKVIQEALENDLREIRFAAVRALMEINDPTAAKTLVSALSDKEAGVREKAAAALGQLNWKPSSEYERILLSGAAKEWDELVKIGEPAIQYLVRSLADDDFYVGKDAKAALQAIDGEAVYKALAQALRDNDFTLRFQAAFTLKDMGAKFESIEDSVYYHIALYQWDEAVKKGGEALPPLLETLIIHQPFLTDLSGKGPPIDFLHLFHSYSPLLKEICTIPFIEDREMFDFTRKYDITSSNMSVMELCKIEGQISSNILHLVSNRRDIKICIECHSDHPGGETFTTLSFQWQRDRAFNELKKRGNPPYDPTVFKMEASWKEFRQRDKSDKTNFIADGKEEDNTQPNSPAIQRGKPKPEKTKEPKASTNGDIKQPLKGIALKIFFKHYIPIIVVYFLTGVLLIKDDTGLFTPALFVFFCLIMIIFLIKKAKPATGFIHGFLFPLFFFGPQKLYSADSFFETVFFLTGLSLIGLTVGVAVSTYARHVVRKKSVNGHAVVSVLSFCDFCNQPIYTEYDTVKFLGAADKICSKCSAELIPKPVIYKPVDEKDKAVSKKTRPDYTIRQRGSISSNHFRTGEAGFTEKSGKGIECDACGRIVESTTKIDHKWNICSDCIGLWDEIITEGRSGKNFDSQKLHPAGHVMDEKALTISQAIDSLDLPADDRKRKEAETILLEKKAEKPLIQALGHSRETIRMAAADLLGKTGEKEAVPALIYVLSDPNDRVRAMAADRLGYLKDEKAIFHLEKALQDENLHVRFQAVRSLGVIGKPAVMKPLIAAMSDTDERIRDEAAYFINEITVGKASHEEIDPITSTMSDDENNGFIQPVASSDEDVKTENVKQLVETLLCESNCEIRKEAAMELERIKWEPENAWQKTYFLMALSRLGKDLIDMGESAVKPLIYHLREKDETVRENAAVVLGAIADRRATKPLISLLQRETSESIKEYIVRALGSIAAPEAENSLVETMKTGGVNLKRLASVALDNIGWKPSKAEDKVWYRISKQKWNEASVMGKTAVEPILKTCIVDNPFILEYRSEAPAVNFEKLFGDYAEVVRKLAVIEYVKEGDIMESRRIYRLAPCLAAVEYLCGIETKESSNLLHMVAIRKDVDVFDFHRLEYEVKYKKLDFDAHRIMAKRELDKRNNPPYEHGALRSEHS